MKSILFSCLSLALAAFPGLTTNLHADTPAPTNSTEAILRHPGFREGLVWIGTEPSQQQSDRLLLILQDLKKPVWRDEVEKFLNDYPDSPWAASLHHAYACFCQRTGRTTKALDHWEAGWKLVKDDTSVKGQRRLGGAILANWMDQLSSLGRHDKLKELIAVGDQWQFVNHQDREKFLAAKNSYHLMGTHPEMAFRCGTLALKAVGQTLQPTNQSLENLVNVPSPSNGFSVAALEDMANKYGLNLVAEKRTKGRDLIVPSIVHWRQNHYAAIIGQTNDQYRVIDPTFGKPPVDARRGNQRRSQRDIPCARDD